MFAGYFPPLCWPFCNCTRHLHNNVEIKTQCMCTHKPAKIQIILVLYVSPTEPLKQNLLFYPVFTLCYGNQCVSHPSKQPTKIYLQTCLFMLNSYINSRPLCWKKPICKWRGQAVRTFPFLISNIKQSNTHTKPQPQAQDIPNPSKILVSLWFMWPLCLCCYVLRLVNSWWFCQIFNPLE